jgi:hypothetical protein
MARSSVPGFDRWRFIECGVRGDYFFAALSFAHLARCAARVFAKPAAEMRGFRRIETTFRPRARAQRAFCEAEIFARAEALILRGPCDPRVFNPVRAAIAVFSAFTCRAALSRSAFNSASMSMCLPRARIVTGDQRKEALLESAAAYNSPRAGKLLWQERSPGCQTNA